MKNKTKTNFYVYCISHIKFLLYLDFTTKKYLHYLGLKMF